MLYTIDFCQRFPTDVRRSDAALGLALAIQAMTIRTRKIAGRSLHCRFADICQDLFSGGTSSAQVNLFAATFARAQRCLSSRRMRDITFNRGDDRAQDNTEQRASRAQPERSFS